MTYSTHCVYLTIEMHRCYDGIVCEGKNVKQQHSNVRIETSTHDTLRMKKIKTLNGANFSHYFMWEKYKNVYRQNVMNSQCLMNEWTK